jgi:methionyl aminopeptidase
MNDTIYEKYKQAGAIAAEVCTYGSKLIKPEILLLDVAEKIEAKIKEKGGLPAFPVNLSRNEIAAHYSPRHDDPSVFKSGDVVKLDVGVHVDGYIADMAVTLELETNKYEAMIRASDEALEAAIGTIKANVNLQEIGSVVHQKIVSHGYRPIENLTGHSLHRYELHAGLSIPNIPTAMGRRRPQVDDVVAIEPFATDGHGQVIAGEGSNIFLCNNSIKARLIRDVDAKKLYSYIRKNFSTLPFAQRWVQHMASNSSRLLRKLAFLGLIKHYPQLIERQHGMVTQKEHTVIITEEGCEVTTAP